MAKIKVMQKILNAKGEELRPRPNDPVVVLRDVLVNSILESRPVKCPNCGTPVINDKPEEVKKKYLKYEIFKKIQDPKKEEVELTSEEISILKEEVGRIQPILIMGQVHDMLEGK